MGIYRGPHENFIKMFSYFNQNNEVKDISVRYGQNWSDLETDNAALNSIFEAVDDGDGVVQAEELNKLNKIFAYIDNLVKKTKNNGILEQNELEKFQSNLKKGKIDIDNLPDSEPETTNWSEGLDRNITAIKLSGTSTAAFLPQLKEELREIAEEQGFTVEEIESGIDPWVEDSSIRRADGKQYVQYYCDKNVSFDKVDKLSIDNRSVVAGQGRVYNQGNAFELDIDNNNRYYGSSYLEGGNVLNTCLADGTPAAVVGESSIAYTLKVMGLENTEENVEIAKQQIASDLGLKVENVTFIPQYDFHIDMTYRPLHNGEFAVPDYEGAIRLLKETSIPSLDIDYKDVKSRLYELLDKVSDNAEDIMGRSYTIDSVKDILEDTPVTLRFMVSKVVDTYNKAPEKLEGLVSDETMQMFILFSQSSVRMKEGFSSDKEILIKELEELCEASKSARTLAEEALTAGGYKVVKIPAFTGTNNFMNGVAGTSAKTGDSFYITNKPTTPELEGIMTEYFQQAGVDKVYFVSTTDALRSKGGIDCLTQEE